MCSSLAWCSAPGISWALAVESSKRAGRPRKDGVEVVRRSTIDGLCLQGFWGVWAVFSTGALCFAVFCARMVFGESSGERDGNEVRDLFDGGVCGVELFDAYRRGLIRTVPDLWLFVEAVEVWEEVRSRCLSPLSSIAKGYLSLANSTTYEITYKRAEESICLPRVQ